MRLTSNCPTAPFFDPGQPVRHDKPVHHPGPIRDWPAACVWAQLEWERERNDGGPQFLENLELRWNELAGIGQALRLHDQAFRMAVLDILEREEVGQEA